MFFHDPFCSRFQRLEHGIEFTDMRNQWNHHLRVHIDSVCRATASRVKNRLHLHAIQAGYQYTQADAPGSEHRVGFLQRFHTLQHSAFYFYFLQRPVHFFQAGQVLHAQFEVGEFHQQIVGGWQKLVQWRIEQADDDRQSVHCPEKAFKIGTLHGHQQCDGFCPFRGRVGGDHPLHYQQAIFLEKHVFGAAQANAFGTVFPGALSVFRVVRISPNTKFADVIRPGQDLEQVWVPDIRYHGWQFGMVDQAVVTINGQIVAFLDHQVVPYVHQVLIKFDFNFLDAHDSRLAELAGDQRRMTGTATFAGHDALGREHAMDIVRAGFRPHQDDILAIFFCPAHGKVRIKCDDTDRGAG